MLNDLKDKIFSSIEKLKKFLREVNSEGKKVSWSSKEELIAATSVVVVVTIAVALFLGLVDLTFSYIFKLIGS